MSPTCEMPQPLTNIFDKPEGATFNSHLVALLIDCDSSVVNKIASTVQKGFLFFIQLSCS